MLQAPPPPVVQYLTMANARVGWAVGGPSTDRVLHLYRTTDGGLAWTRIRGPEPAAAPTTIGPDTVYFPTLLHGTIVIERSRDGGRTWRASRPIRDGGRPAAPGAVQRLDARRLYLGVGEGAAAGSSAESLWRSVDGGRTWTFVSRTRVSGPVHGSLPFSCDKTGYGFATPSRGWAGGDCAGGPAFLYRTADGGRTWRRVPLAGLGSCACDVSPPQFFGGRVGVFSVAGFPEAGAGPPVARVYWTSDGGLHWRVTSPPVGRVGQTVSVAGPRIAWLTGTAPGTVRARFDRLLVTTDAGRTWRSMRLPFDGQAYRLDALDGHVAYAVGGLLPGPALRRTVDGGRTWRTLSPRSAP